MKNKYDFMQEMTRLAYNRHRQQMGLEAVSYAQMESSSPGEPAKAPGTPPAGFNGRAHNPLPLGGKDGAG